MLNPQNYSARFRNPEVVRSTSADNVVIRTRGFKPSDRHDPSKRVFLEKLSTKILHFDMDSGDKAPVPISLEKLLTPAMDCSELLQTKKKMYASSCFYAPTHPTVEDQVELARRISYSLSDAKNMKSKGQSMYVNRKKRSVKWIHDGNGAEADEEPQTSMYKDKVPLKCMMNPNGKVLDIHCIQALGEEPNIGTSPINADKLFDIVRDLNNHKGRGAEIFAKRRKRSEKWVVDKDQPSTPTQNYPKASTYPSKLDYGANENSQLSNIPPPQNDSKPFFNPFTMDLSLDNGNMPSGSDPRWSRPPPESYSRRYEESRKPGPEVKKIYLREVAVGTEPDYPMNFINGHQNGLMPVEKSRRMSFDSERYESSQQQMKPPHRIKKNAGQNPQSYANYTNHYVNQSQGQGERMLEEEDENDYTPVPVKQLIQEFEKTCRPVLQYKQLSRKIVPVVQQQAPLEDISRFFNAARPQKKYEDSRTVAKYASNGQSAHGSQTTSNGHGNNGYARGYQGAMVPRYEYDSTDDEIDDSFGESSCSENGQNYYGPSPGPGFSSGNGLSAMSDYDYRRQMFDCATEQLFDSPGFSTIIDEKFVDTEATVGAETKALNLAMIASQEDIMEQIKQLRRTPVVENLVPGPSPDRSKLGDFIPELANKMLESTYNGPKISSYQALTNYNTAPRGWDQSQAVYRPITFRKPQEPIAYSDF
ncbi:uncharacterized protein LOC107045494 [Diachasma alloeum]|uniref:uncharacterized protein LOC107045494 n=1 Tax=Diachasma alloeum TaxID=454923 RepID=UPI0010FB1566|nr:uncharacterized protein LOC107045494 [Diachasma alloeum]